MSRQTLEKFQVVVYALALASGLGVGWLWPGQVGVLEVWLWPILAALLYATFTQVPLGHVRQVMADARFIGTAIVGNFLVIPALVWVLLQFAPADPALRLGVALVLVVPCTDWFITFTHLGQGDTQRAIAFAPVSLGLQMALLPVYLWLFFGATFALTAVRQEMLAAFVGIILLPLLAAWLTERWVGRVPGWGWVLARLAWWPVPLLGVVMFIIAATQVQLVAASVEALGPLLLIFGSFLALAGGLARGMARLGGLPVKQGRALAFSYGTRNSFVVLPLALALPPGYELAVVAVVFQSLVELAGMVLYVWWVPRGLFPPEAG